MHFNGTRTEGFYRQQRRQLEAVQYDVERLVALWELDTEVGSIETTLYQGRELRIFTKAQKGATSLILKVSSLFPGSLSQHDIVGEVANVGPDEQYQTQPTPANQKNVAKTLHPISPELFYGKFNQPRCSSLDALTDFRRMAVLLRGKPEKLAQQIIDLLLAVKSQQSKLFSKIEGFDLIDLDNVLPKTNRDQIALTVADALEIRTDGLHAVIRVFAMNETQTPSVFSLCANAGVTLVCDPSLAIDALNAGSPCLLVKAEPLDNSKCPTEQNHYSCVNYTQSILACLSNSNLRRDLVNKQRESLITNALPTIDYTSIHGDISSLGSVICEAVKSDQVIGPVQLKKMWCMLAFLPYRCFGLTVTAKNQSCSIGGSVQAYRRRTTRKWRKLRNSPVQFVRDSFVFKRLSAGRQQ